MVVILSLGFVVGLVVGSYLLALVYRLSHNYTLGGRSYCERCKKSLFWYDLFPVVSYLVLSGKCRACQQKISWELPLTEITVGLLYGLLFLTNYQFLESLIFNGSFFSLPGVVAFLFQMFVIFVAVVVFLTDAKTGYIYNKITYPAIMVALFYHYFLATTSSFIYIEQFRANPLFSYLSSPYSNFLLDQLSRSWNLLIGAIFSALGMGLFFITLIIITYGRGMGWGDVKYVIFLGLALGFPKSLVALFSSFLLGAVFATILLLTSQKKLGQTVPFGPFLSLGTIIALLFGEQLLNSYLTLLT